MKRKGKESKLNILLTSLLVVFVCLLSFAIGVISGKGWSDREYQVRHIENDSHLKAAQDDVEPIGDEMTEKEVELLTKRALEEAQAEKPKMEPSAQTQPKEEMSEMKTEVLVAQKDDKEKPGKPKGDKPKGDDKPAGEEKPNGRDASMAKMESKEPQRKVSSVPDKPSTPKPTSIEYTVQVAAYKTVEEAEKHSQKLIDKGFPAFPVKTLLRGEMWYRVSVGSFKSRKAAVKYNRALQKQTVVKDSFVTKIKRLKK